MPESRKCSNVYDLKKKNFAEIYIKNIAVIMSLTEVRTDVETCCSLLENCLDTLVHIEFHNFLLGTEMKVKRKSPNMTSKAKKSGGVNDGASTPSGVKIWKHTKVWDIEAFFERVDRCQSFTSHDCRKEDDEEQWRFIVVIHNDRTDKRRYLTITVDNENMSEFGYNHDFKSLQFVFKVQILDKDGFPVFSFYRKHQGAWDDHVSIRKCVTMDEIIKHRNRFQENGNLTISCHLIEVRFYDNEPSCSFASVSEQDMSDVGQRKNSNFTFKRMLDEMIFTDMTIKTAEKVFPCHKAVLASASPFFSVMLNTNMKEKNENLLDLSDVLDADTVEDMLKFIYSDEVPNIENTCEKLLLASDVYNLSALKERCEKEVSKKLTTENAADIFQLAVKHNAQLLKEKTIMFMTTYSNDVLQSEAWKNIPDDVSKVLFSNFVSLVDYVN